MFQPPPEPPQDQISEKPMPALPTLGAEPTRTDESQLAPGAPQGEELIHYVIGCLDKGSSQAEVRKQLIAFGYTSAEAEETVDWVSQYRRKHPQLAGVANTATSGGGNANMWFGGIVCLVGIVITVGSFMAAGQGGGGGGGRYFIAWGAILWGGIQFFRGLSQRNQ